MIILDTRIVKLPTHKVWQWAILVDGWPVSVGSTEALQCWFASCALEDYHLYV